MITQIYSNDGLILSTDHYGGKIGSYIGAYGCGYDFCRFYRTATGVIMIFNGGATVSGEMNGEIWDFLTLNGVCTVSCEGEDCPVDFKAVKRTMFYIPPFETDSDKIREASLRDMYSIVECCFDTQRNEESYSLWYTDMSHRIRHGVTKAFMYENKGCISVDFIHGGTGCITQLAVMPEYRKNGIARSMLGFAEKYISSFNARAYVWAEDEAAQYYVNIGCVPEKTAFTYERLI